MSTQTESTTCEWCEHGVSAGIQAGAPVLCRQHNDFRDAHDCCRHWKKLHTIPNALDLSEIDDTKSDDHIALQLANLVLRKDVVRLAKENAELKRLAGLSVKHRWHAAGEVALDKLADYLPNDQMRDG